MTPTPRANNKLHDRRGYRPADLARKAAAYTVAGVALAGVATVTAVTGLTGVSAASAQPASLDRVVLRAPHMATHTTSRRAAPAKDALIVHAAIGKFAAPARHATPARQAAAADHTAPSKHTAPAKHKAPARPHKKSRARHANTWSAIRRMVASRTYPKATGHGPLPAQDQLTPVGISGPQSWLPMTSYRYDNAKAIVRAALDRHMGLRSAVIAVATAMQESGLVNVNYGTSDSLGLFQQRPSCGWGSAAQIMHPSYAAGAFLSALHSYQQRTPSWASAPLWQSAQGVQVSAYPYAYAKWEAQAANVVASITKRLV